MKVSLSNAKARLCDLVRRAQAGEDVVVTRHGRPAVRLAPVAQGSDRAGRRRILEAARWQASWKVIHGPGAAESQDFLYDERDLPQ